MLCAHLHFDLLFWVALLVVPRLTNSRGTRIKIYEQPGNLHRGPGDIANLWPGFGGQGFRGPMRNAIKTDSPNRWTRYTNDRGQFIIPYIISGKFDSAEHTTIALAMMAISQNTCIKFEKRGGEADYVDLRNERGEGCYTVVGRSPGKNTVMLETNEIATCLEFDIVIHELMHTIGLWHEQMRYDRDEFIKIHYENIAPAYITQFEKVPETDSTTYGVRYDYQSVMHYAKDAFASAPGKITMETLDKQFQDVIGKVNDASPSDYLKICNIYACHSCMGRPFTPGQSVPAAGQRVVTLGPTPLPPPETLPVRPTTIESPPPPPPKVTINSTRGSGEMLRPTPLLPIILPLINNNWWWKNTPAPPLGELRDPHGNAVNATGVEKRNRGSGNYGSKKDKGKCRESPVGVQQHFSRRPQTKKKPNGPTEKRQLGMTRNCSNNS